MALTKFLILRKPLRGCLEERTALIQAIEKFFTASSAGKTGNYYCVFLIVARTVTSQIRLTIPAPLVMRGRGVRSVRYDAFNDNPEQGGLLKPWPRPAVLPRSSPPMWRGIRG